MHLWEKAALNMQKGSRKVAAAAATFAERIRAEIAVVRLRVRIDEVRSRTDELHRAIGVAFVELHRKNELRKELEPLLQDDAVQEALAELDDRGQELAELREEIRRVRSDFDETVKQTEDALA